jgi:dTDP-4-dehydrorhamnose 3,5-epimerase-like enzyme
MIVHEFDVPGLKLIVPKRFSDPRGYFSETWSDRQFRQEIAELTFVQDNQSVSARKGTLRSAFPETSLCSRQIDTSCVRIDIGRRSRHS